MRQKRSPLAVLAFALSLAACAGDPDPASSPSGGAVQRFVPPTATEVAAYQQELAQLFAQPAAPVAATAGGQIADVSGQANVALAKIDGEGRLDTTCVENQQEAVRFLTRAKASAQPLEVK